MFDIGFAELLLIGVVGLLVIGPERLPGAIRTTSAWVSRIRRGFDEVKAEVQRELHNDEIMRELKSAAKGVENEIHNAQTAVDDEYERGREAVERQLNEAAGFGDDDAKANEDTQATTETNEEPAKPSEESTATKS